MKIGDKVRYLGTGVLAAKPGARARVMGFKGGYVVLRWIRWSRAHKRKVRTQLDGGYNPHDFVVIGQKS